jgi:hypothetical protein
MRTIHYLSTRSVWATDTTMALLGGPLMLLHEESSDKGLLDMKSGFKVVVPWYCKNVSNEAGHIHSRFVHF